MMTAAPFTIPIIGTRNGAACQGSAALTTRDLDAGALLAARRASVGIVGLTPGRILRSRSGNQIWKFPGTPVLS
jgi:hypothetical protein